ncbi:hypothetical protein [Actibacterium ureilyticum]|uniref:hypothetical protein n=1 Tax=Actibacterium ureilyticum TaxID=1590614 RepID=UPI000BAAA506|nr:hypothetical protein [Actibacterium ureilyticum]
MEQPLCVLTGDLIGSTALPDGQVAAAMAALRDAAGQISGWPDAAPARFTPYRGDGWQMVLRDPARALRAALFLRASLRVLGKPFATRIALATGVEALGAGPDLSGETGPNFVASGRALDAMPRGTELVWAAGGARDAVFRLADHISAGWTPAQARAVARMLPPTDMTHAAAAQALGISRQAVDQALGAAGYPALHQAIALFERDFHAS